MFFNDSKLLIAKLLNLEENDIRHTYLSDITQTTRGYVRLTNNLLQEHLQDVH